MILKAKNPYIFIAFCFEYTKYFNHTQSADSNKPFKTHLPIQLDATCNGFQHLALLCNERDLFQKLNLVSDNPTSLNNQPEDFYTYILFLVGSASTIIWIK